MKLHLLSTVGTSALTNTPPKETLADQFGVEDRRHKLSLSFEDQRRLLGQHGDEAEVVSKCWLDASLRAFPQWLAAATEAFRQGQPDRGMEALRQVTAELSALCLLRHSDEIEIGSSRLIVSDTPEGRFAGEIVQRTLAGWWPEIEHLPPLACPGLRPDTPDDFEHIGLPGLSGLVSEELEQRPHSALNLTGGLKAGIPFLTAMAMQHDVDLFYLFERAPALTRVKGATLKALVYGGHTGQRLDLSTSVDTLHPDFN